MGCPSVPFPPLPKDPKERAEFMRAYVEVNKRPSPRRPDGGHGVAGVGLVAFLLGWAFGND